MRTQKLEFEGGYGDTLVGRLDLPDSGQPQAYALFAHCLTCTKNLRAIGNINRALAEARIGCLRFDFTGLGESEGDFADTSFSSNVEDLVAAADFLAAEYAPPTLLIGHSLGGAAVLQAAHRIGDASAVATIAAPSEPTHVRRLITGREAEVEATGKIEVMIGPSRFRVGKQFFDDLEQNNMRDCISGLDSALLVLHSPLDTVVGIDNAAQIFEVAKHPKSFVSLDDADHLLMQQEDSLYAGRIIATWVERYL